MKIYKLIKDDKVVYVGATTYKHLSSRTSIHRYYGKEFDSYDIIEETDDKLREAYWVEKHWNTCSHNNGGYNKTRDGKGCYGDTRTVRVYNENGFNKIYKSLTSACRELGLDSRMLSRVGLGQRNHHKGYGVEYLDEQ